jgi:hypothetical protein
MTDMQAVLLALLLLGVCLILLPEWYIDRKKKEL